MNKLRESLLLVTTVNNNNKPQERAGKLRLLQERRIFSLGANKALFSVQRSRGRLLQFAQKC